MVAFTELRTVGAVEQIAKFLHGASPFWESRLYAFFRSLPS
jgi:hypothetical protein